MALHGTRWCSSHGMRWLRAPPTAAILLSSFFFCSVPSTSKLVNRDKSNLVFNNNWSILQLFTLRAMAALGLSLYLLPTAHSPYIYYTTCSEWSKHPINSPFFSSCLSLDLDSLNIFILYFINVCVSDSLHAFEGCVQEYVSTQKEHSAATSTVTACKYAFHHTKETMAATSNEQIMISFHYNTERAHPTHAVLPLAYCNYNLFFFRPILITCMPEMWTSFGFLIDVCNENFISFRCVFFPMHIANLRKLRTEISFILISTK